MQQKQIKYNQPPAPPEKKKTQHSFDVLKEIDSLTMQITCRSYYVEQAGSEC